MKKKIFLLIMMMAMLTLTGCGKEEKEAAALDASSLDTPQSVKSFLMEGNEIYVSSEENKGDISEERRTDTAENGQFPYAVVITCSDSRVPPEHIFSAGIGDLFVIRTAGNVIGNLAVLNMVQNI